MRWKYWSDYLRNYRGSLGALFGALALAVLQSVLLFPIALLVREAFNRLIPAGDFQGLLACGAAILLLYALGNACQLWNRHLSLKITKIVTAHIRCSLIDRMFGLSRSFFTRNDHSRIHAAVVQDTERIDVMSNALIAMFLPALLVTLGLGGLLIALDPVLSLVVIAVVPPLAWLGHRLGNRVRRKVRDYHRDFETFSKGVLFVIRKHDLAKAQAAEAAESSTQKQAIQDLRRTSGKMAWTVSAYIAVQGFLLACTGILILVIGGWEVIHGKKTLGDLLSFYATLALMKDQVRMLVESIPQILAGGESLRSLYELMHDAEPAPYSGRRKFTFGGELEVQNVSFRHGEKEILRGVSLRLSPGKITVLAGPSGVGKSTLLSLILGFYRPAQGALRADGIPFEEIDFSDFRRQIGVILQEPLLFSGTIADNIRYGVPEASEAEMRSAAQAATADEFIDPLPEGYETAIGEDGIRLSGGQCQRLAIARALLRKPALLILDEPTAHLDPATVRRLLHNLKAYSDRAGILVVSHDPNLLTEADEHLYMELGGRLQGEFPKDFTEPAVKAGESL